MENNAFSSPQRQSKTGIVLLTLVNIGKFIRTIGIFLIIAFFRKNNMFSFPFLLGTVLIFTLVAVYTLLDYWSFSYFIDTKNDKFVIKKGIINKKEIGIEKSKIQEVNINQPFIHRLLNVYELEIDSPGSDKKEVKVNAISYQNALDIKNYLLHHQIEKAATENQEISKKENEKDVLKISLISLFKYGITANYLRSFAAIIGFFFYIRQQISEVLNDLKWEDYLLQQNDLEENLQQSVAENFSFFYAFIFVFIILLIGILVSLIMTIFKYFGMKIHKKEKQLSLEYGLLNTKNAIIAKEKVQMITENQNFLQKKWDVSYLKFSQISNDEDHHKGEKNGIPGCNSLEKQDLIHFIWKNLKPFEFSLKPNFRRLISRNIIFIVIPIIISIFARELLRNYWIWMLLYVVLAELMIIFSYLNNRMFYDGNFIQVKSGVWDISKKTIETEKIQAVQLSQYIWQRKSDLGSVHFFTAGGAISFRTASYEKLKKLVNFSLFKVESSKKNWM